MPAAADDARHAQARGCRPRSVHDRRARVGRRPQPPSVWESGSLWPTTSSPALPRSGCCSAWPRPLPARVADDLARLGAAAHERAEGARAAGCARSRRPPGSAGQPRGLGLRADHLHRLRRDRRYGCAPAAGIAAPLDGSAIAKVLLAGARRRGQDALGRRARAHPAHVGRRARARSRAGPAARLGADDAEGSVRATRSPRRSGTPTAPSPRRSASTSPTASHRSTSTRTRAPSSPRRRESRRRCARRAGGLSGRELLGELLERAGSSGGVTTVTGAERLDGVGRSLRSQSDRCLGSVEIRMSS